MDHKRWLNVRAGLALAGVLALAQACGDDGDDDNKKPVTDAGQDAGDKVDSGGGGGGEDAGTDSGVKPLGNCVEVAQADGRFTNILLLANLVGLVEDLSKTQDLTIFAPTDEAVTAFGKELMAAGGTGGLPQTDEEKAQTKALLQYHVLSTKESAADLAAVEAPGIVANTLLQTVLFVGKEGNDVVLNKRAKVTQADVPCSNGVIHVIDKVLLPLNTAQAAGLAGLFNNLVAAVTADANKAVLAAISDTTKPVTVFAPLDTAFTEAGLTGADATAAILSYHAIEGRVLSPMLTNGPVPTLLADKSITVGVSAAGVTINTDAKVVVPNIITTTGAIHVIDKVLNPETGGVFVKPQVP